MVGLSEIVSSAVYFKSLRRFTQPEILQQGQEEIGFKMLYINSENFYKIISFQAHRIFWEQHKCW